MLSSALRRLAASRPSVPRSAASGASRSAKAWRSASQAASVGNRRPRSHTRRASAGAGWVACACTPVLAPASVRVRARAWLMARRRAGRLEGMLGILVAQGGQQQSRWRHGPQAPGRAVGENGPWPKTSPAWKTATAAPMPRCTTCPTRRAGCGCKAAWAPRWLPRCRHWPPRCRAVPAVQPQGPVRSWASGPCRRHVPTRWWCPRATPPRCWRLGVNRSASPVPCRPGSLMRRTAQRTRPCRWACTTTACTSSRWAPGAALRPAAAACW